MVVLIVHAVYVAAAQIEPMVALREE